MNSFHAFSNRSATFSCAVTGYIRSTYQADQQVLTDPWFAHLFFCQPIFIGDDAVLFRDPDPERRPITPRYFNPAFSGLRVSASRGLESSIFLVAADTSRWASPVRSRHCYHYFLYRQIHCSSRLTGLEMDRPTLDLSSLDDVIYSCFRNSNQRCIRQE